MLIGDPIDAICGAQTLHKWNVNSTDFKTRKHRQVLWNSRQRKLLLYLHGIFARGKWYFNLLIVQLLCCNFVTDILNTYMSLFDQSKFECFFRIIINNNHCRVHWQIWSDPLGKSFLWKKKTPSIIQLRYYLVWSIFMEKTSFTEILKVRKYNFITHYSISKFRIVFSFGTIN